MLYLILTDNIMYDFSTVTGWVHGFLTMHMPDWLTILLECVLVGVCILLLSVVIAVIMIYMERKVCAAF